MMTQGLQRQNVLSIKLDSLEKLATGYSRVQQDPQVSRAVCARGRP